MPGQSKENLQHLAVQEALETWRKLKDIKERGDEIPEPKKKKISAKKPAKAQKAKSGPKPKKSKKASVEAASSNGQEETAIAHRLRNNRSNTKLEPFDLAKLLEKTMLALSTIGEPEDIKDYLGKDAFPDAASRQWVQANCQEIKTLLQQIGELGDASDAPLPSTLNFYDQYIVARSDSSNLLYLARPVEVFQGNDPAYNRRKTFGLVRTKGTTFPLMCALSGWQNVTKEHPRMLDSAEWLELVKQVAPFFGHKFKRGQFDKRHKREDGDEYASHVEPSLMLWYACYLHRKLTGVDMPFKERLGHLFKLQKSGRKFEAEILLSKGSCSPCEIFQAGFEAFTGIKFTFPVMDNYAPVLPLKNEQNFEYYPQFGSYNDEEDFELAVEQAMEGMFELKKAKSTFAVEIPHSRHPVAKVSNTKHLDDRQQATVSSRSQVVTTSSTSTSTHIQKIQGYSYKAPQKLTPKSNNTTITLYAGGQAPVQHPRSKIVGAAETTPAKQSHGKAPPTPDSHLFPLEMRQRAKNQRREEKRRVQEFPDPATPSKKARWDDYSLTPDKFSPQGKLMNYGRYR